MIVSYDDLIPEVQALYESGLPRGSSTGWRPLDDFYTVGMNQWTLVTGIPNSGKSEWLDAMMVNLAMSEKWRFPIFSPENHPLALHAAKILEKYTGKPFGAGPTERMTPKERDDGLAWMKGVFRFMKFDEPHLGAVLEEAMEFGSLGTQWKLGVVIDPWNTLEHRRPREMTGTEYVSEQLSWIIKFTRANYAHLWLVAHPKKMEKDRDGKRAVPSPYDISDSAHFYNKADNIITVHREQVEGSQMVDVFVQKCRFKHIGRIGQATLRYDRVTGKYYAPNPNLRAVTYADKDEARI